MVNRIPSPQSPNKVSRRILPVPHINKDQSLFKGDWDRILGRGDKEYPSEDQRSEGSHSSLEDVFQKEMIHLVKYGGTGSLSGFLNRHPEVDINYKDEKGYTALHYAAFGGDISKVKELLLISGVDIDCPSGNRSRSEDKMRNTPLHWAARGGHLEVAELLIEAGADPEVKNLAGNTACDMVEDTQGFQELLPVNSKDLKGYTALHYAAFGGDVSKVKELLLIEGIDIDCISGNRSRSEDKMRNTPLHWAVKEGHLEVAKLLIEAGADPEVKNLAGNTAFNMVEDGDKDGFNELFEKNAGDQRKPSNNPKSNTGSSLRDFDLARG